MRNIKKKYCNRAGLGKTFRINHLALIEKREKRDKVKQDFEYRRYLAYCLHYKTGGKK